MRFSSSQCSGQAVSPEFSGFFANCSTKIEEWPLSTACITDYKRDSAPDFIPRHTVEHRAEAQCATTLPFTLQQTWCACVVMRKIMKKNAAKFWISKNNGYICNPKRCYGRAVRHWSAKPSTAVRFCLAPLQALPDTGQRFFLYCNPNLVTAFRAHAFSIGKPGEIPKFMGTTGGDCSRQEETSADIDL